MKINLKDINLDEFNTRAGFLGGDNVTLVYPKDIGCKWTNQNLFLRSSVWDSAGNLVSASFPKFFNWHEHPELTYTPFSTTANGGINVIEKVDGSTLIVSYFNNQLIMRTRGTLDASALETGDELKTLQEKYSKVFDKIKNDAQKGTTNYSLLFEWVTPDNVIVLRYGEPDMILIGKIYHDDYSMETQANLDILGKELDVPRPDKHHYDSIKELLEDVVTWEGKEGVCVYCNKDQNIRKIKGEWYLALHRMKSELGSFGRVVDVFITMERPKFNDFYNILVEAYDFEIAERCRPHLSLICDAMKEVDRIVEGMHTFVKGIQTLPTRKEQALKVLSAYGDTNRGGFVFSILDGKELDNEQYKKLLYQVVKQPEEQSGEDSGS